MEKNGVRGTVTVNSDVCNFYPRIIEEGLKLKWHWMGHGPNNSTFLNKQSFDEERALIHDVLERITQTIGRRPKGWLGPALAESFNTLVILAEEGIEYVADWCNDDQPYRMKTKTGTMYSISYSVEINDICALIDLKRSV